LQLAKYSLSLNKKWLGFIPGSRDNEIKNILPEIVNTIKKLSAKKAKEYEILISYSDSVTKSLFDEITASVKANISVVRETHSLMKYSDFLICKSGTASLEAAYIGTPLIVIYKTSFISYLIAKSFIKIDMIAMPNIILGEKVIPELIQQEVNPETILNYIDKFFENNNNYKELELKLKNVGRELKGKKPSKYVAKIITDLIDGTKN